MNTKEQYDEYVKEYEQLELVPSNHEALLTACAEVRDFSEFSRVRAFAPYLVRAMRREKGVGISANQMGVLMKMFVVDVPGDQTRILINPVVAPYGTVYRVNEGCLSFPKQTFHRKRHQHVRVDAYSLKGQKFRLDTMALPLRQSQKMLLAVAIQHENDHINGRDVRFDA